MKRSFWKWIQRLDQTMLDKIEKKFSNPRWNPVMDFFSHPPHWRYLALAVIAAGLILGTPETRWQIGFLLLAITLSDQSCNLIKALVKRVRPDGERASDGGFWQRLGRYSFPSSHSADNFCAAVMTLYWWPYLGIFFCFWGLTVAFSRVYLKNHYPSDVLVGALIGVAYGILFIYFFPH